MVNVKCPKCGQTTDRLYELPYGSEERGWMCENCVMERCNIASLDEWSDEDFKIDEIERVEG